MRPPTPICTCALAATIAVALPTASVAKRPTQLAPPGNSAISQYAEVVPNDLGASPPGSGGVRVSLAGSRAIRGLEGSGPDGQLFAAVVDATAPPPLRASVAHARENGVQPQGFGGLKPDIEAWRRGTESPAALIFKSADGGGLGIVLAGIAVAGGLGLIGRALRHRRAG